MSHLSWVDLVIIVREVSLYGTVILGFDRLAKGHGFCHGCLPHQQRIFAGRICMGLPVIYGRGGWGSDEHCEPQARFSANEFHYFLARARGSLVEVEKQLMIAQNLEYSTPEHGKHLMDKAAELGKILNGLIGAIRLAAKPGTMERELV